MLSAVNNVSVPFYERTLDSFADDVITRTEPPNKANDPHSCWYAWLDVGPERWGSDPDFATGAPTRKEAIRRCAEKIRRAAREGRHRNLLSPGYDLHFRLMKHWCEKEAR